MVRVTVYHRKYRQVVGITSSPKEVPERFIGEVNLPVKTLMLRDAVIAGGELVGWFTLMDMKGQRQGIACSGEIKLGLRLVDPHLLQASDTPASLINQGNVTPSFSWSDFAILR